ncbi:hypothetical protein OROHE_017741 [Orobanche hederae]
MAHRVFNIFLFEPVMSTANVAVSKPIKIREVWSENLESEIALLSDLVDRYPIISMDTKFPGVIFKLHEDPHAQRPSRSDHYRILKSNVDALKLIQLGITLSDVAGNLPSLGPDGELCIWKFNFSDFDADRDMHAPDSIELLRSQGIDIERSRRSVVDSARFAELMMGSGLVCNDAVSWVTFHNAYAFGYLVKILTSRLLPARIDEFMDVLKAFFGDNVYVGIMRELAWGFESGGADFVLVLC